MGVQQNQTQTGDKKMSNSQAVKILIEKGARHEKKEDFLGDTKSGWWMDQTFLAPYKMPQLALQVLEG